MPDPYAKRALAVRPLEGPGGELPWGDAAANRCLLLADSAEAGLEPERPAAIVVGDSAVLAPIARLEPPLAASLLTVARPGGSSAAASEALTALRARSGPIYLLKHGPVAGPAGAPGCAELDPATLESVLAADEQGAVTWERDPDFGYRVAAAVPGLGPEAIELLCPRLRYAAYHRVYEHAELVAETKRALHERSGGSGLPPEVMAAVRWPPEPTGAGWKD